MPAVLAIFNEPIMSCFSPPGLRVAPYTHKVGWKQSKYNQASRDDDATAQLDVEGQKEKKNTHKIISRALWEVRKPVARIEK